MILQQRFELDVKRRQDGLRLQRELAETNASHILPALNDTLDRLFDPDDFVEIDQLHLDLGDIHPDADAEIWANRIAAALARAMETWRREHPPAREDNAHVTINFHGRAVDALYRYLEWGVLEAGAPFTSVDEVLDELASPHPSLTAMIRERIRRLSPTAIRRMGSLPEQRLARLLRVLFPGAPESEWMNLAASAIEKIPRSGSTGLPDQVGREILAALQHETVPDFRKLTDNIIRNEQPGVSAVLPGGDLPLAPTRDGLFVPQAGLCLVAPYLSRFLTALQLADDTGFVSETAQQHAVYLVDHLATGALFADEELLPMAKLLCGWPIHQPCVIGYGITGAEQQESLLLLESLIEHWTVLRHTSPAGLREGFLQRMGKLIDSDDHYTLQVEQRSIDILLEHVPWNFRLIRLPWMNKRIEVEWY